MLKIIKSLKKKLFAVGVSAMAVGAMVITSSAEEPVVDSAFVSGIVTSAGNSILSSVQAMVTAVIPILVGAAMAGFAIYGAKWIFGLVKGFLTKTA